MSKKDERNLNITINNKEEEQNSDIVLTLSTLGKKFKKYFALWIFAAIIFAVLALCYSIITTHTKKASLTSIIGFSYDGIEKGLDPHGRKFDVNTVKNPAVIEAALTELGMGLEELESIRNGISFTDIIPQNAYDKFTVYNNILEKGGNTVLTAGEKLLETSYNPTQFIVEFDYNETTLSDDDAVDVFNMILEKYENYFYITYGYNESLGNAVTAISYEDYDYAEAIDVFDNSLRSLRKYVKQLADEDDARFRSATTGYTFDDLYQAINTISSIDLDKISSYISVNNVTKDKEAALAYYEYRIKALTRDKDQYEEQLAAYEASIAAYEKDQIFVFGGSDETNVQSSVASAEYDKMFSRKNAIASDLAEVKQKINFYKERQQALKTRTNSSKAMTDRVEADLASLNDKVNKLVDDVAATSEDYYKNVTFGNAYNILVPAANTTTNKIARIINRFKFPFVLLEALGVAAYGATVFFESVITDSRYRKSLLEAADKRSEEQEESAGDDEAEDDNDEAEKSGDKEEAKEEKTEKEEEKKNSSKKKNK